MSFAFLLALHAPSIELDDVLHDRRRTRRGRDAVDPRPEALPVERQRHDSALLLDAMLLRQIA